jgi:hypothetical protein
VIPASDQNGPEGAILKVRVIRTPAEVEEIRPAWESWRGHRDADIDVYQTVMNCSDGALQPHIIVVERDGRPDALMVGSTSTSNFNERVAYWHIPVPDVRVLNFQYAGFLGNQSAENSKLMIDEIQRSLQRGDADVAILSYVQENSPLLQLARNIRSPLMRGHFPAPALQSHWMMDIPATADGLYDKLSGDHRKKIRAEAKKFKAAFPDLRMVRFQGTDNLEELVRDTEQVAATTYQRGLGVGFADTRPIRELLSLEARKAWLRGYLLYVGDRPCAFWIGCIYGGVFLSEYLGHDPLYAKHSPGTYLLMCVVEQLRNEGVAAIDFGVGEAFYKQRFGNRSWNESKLYLYAPNWAGIRVKSVMTIAATINYAGKIVLERSHLLGRVKKLWRKRVTHRTSSN